MIKASELRIGNWVESNSTNCLFSKGFIKVDFDVFNKINLAKCEKELYPVILNEKIILNSGFEKQGKSFVKSIHGHGLKKLVLTFNILKNRWIVAFADYYTGNEKTELFPFEIVYVHQLQNLYFEISREELNLSL